MSPNAAMVCSISGSPQPGPARQPPSRQAVVDVVTWLGERFAGRPMPGNC
ncbi:hypothetical protein [Streptomyces lomondensis]|nr:hypothetical protein [Streptomyces lomondensis]MCF0083245.1 hypothetical protein [Streptomyces lomondensis]